MSRITNFFPYEAVSSLGWTLLHSLWQGGIIALILYFALYYARNRNANVKAFLSAASLALLVTAAAVTFAVEYSNASDNKISAAYSNNTGTAPLFENPVDLSTLNNDTTLFSKIYSEAKIYFKNNVELIVALWFAGFLFFAVRFTGGVFYTIRMKRKIYTLDDDKLIQKFSAVGRKAGIRKSIQFAESALVKVPIVLGYFKPVILLPFGLLSGLPQDQIEAIIAHEIAHIKRYDILINLFQSIAEIIFFFNPAVWYISHRIRVERENACDDIAIDLCGNSVVYAKALANVESFKESNEPLFAIPLFKNQNQLLRRIKRMLHKDQNQNGFKEKFAAVLIFIGILVVFAVVKNISPAVAGAETQYNKAGITFPSSIFVGDKELTGIEIDTTKAAHNKRSFSYFQKEDGKMKRYRAKIQDGKLTDLSIDGEKVAKDKLDNYRKDVEEAYTKLDNEDMFFGRDLFPRGGFFPDSLKNLGAEIARSFNNEEFRKEMREMQKEIQESTGKIREHFNSPEFRKEMEDIQREIREKFSSSEIRKSREDVRKELDKLKRELRSENFKRNRDFDQEKFEKKMEEMSVKLERKMKDMEEKGDFSVEKMEALKGLEHLKSLDYLKHNSVAMKGFEKGMQDFNLKMKDFGGKMKVFGEKMKVFGKFMKEVKDMLVDEKLLEEDDDNANLNIKKDGVYIDGKKQSDAVFEKVKKIYKKHFNKEFDGEFHLGIDE